MSGSKTTTNNTEKVTLPAWVSQGGEQNFADARAWSAANPVTPFAGPLSAGANDSQRLASTIAGQTGAGAGDLAAARRLTGAAVAGGAPTVSTGSTGVAMQGPGQAVTADQVRAMQFDPAAIERYRNPYVEQVQNSTLGSMRRENAIEQAGLADQVQASKAFGGARGTLAATELNRNQADARTSYINSSNVDSFNAARAMFDTDAARAMQADMANQGANLSAGTFNSGQAADIAARNAAASNNATQADAGRDLSAQTTNAASQNSLMDRLLQAAQQRSAIGQQAQEFTTNDINNLLRTGATQQNTEQQAIDAKYADTQLNNNAAMQRFQQLAALLGITPTDKTATSNGTTTQSGSLLNTLLSAGQLAASAYGASDRRLKAQITPLGIRTADGLEMHAWRYIGSGEMAVGVMADDVARLRPDALGPVIEGFATVDYERLAA